MDSSIDKLKHVLAKHGYSTTQPRLMLFSILLNNHPISMKELIARLKNSVDRASIYRTLNLFEQIGIVEKLHIGWKHEYELSDEFTHHHHHALCTKCGKIINLEEDNDLESAINNFASQKLFVVTGHSLEIKGVCLACK